MYLWWQVKECWTFNYISWFLNLLDLNFSLQMFFKWWCKNCFLWKKMAYATKFLQEPVSNRSRKKCFWEFFISTSSSCNNQKLVIYLMSFLHHRYLKLIILVSFISMNATILIVLYISSINKPLSISS